MLGLLRRLSGPARVAAAGRAMESGAAREARLRRALQAPVSGLLFICHGNIMRSAFAVAVATDVLRQCGRPSADRAADVLRGAGTHATLGRPAESTAMRAASALGLPLDEHSATPLGGLALRPGEIAVCMDRANEANTIVWAGPMADRVFLVGDIAALQPDSRLPLGTPGALHEDEGYAERMVRDPYGRGDEATARAFGQVRRYVQAWMTACEGSPIFCAAVD